MSSSKSLKETYVECLIEAGIPGQANVTPDYIITDFSAPHGYRRRGYPIMIGDVCTNSPETGLVRVLNFSLPPDHDANTEAMIPDLGPAAATFPLFTLSAPEILTLPTTGPIAYSASEAKATEGELEIQPPKLELGFKVVGSFQPTKNKTAALFFSPSNAYTYKLGRKSRFSQYIKQYHNVFEAQAIHHPGAGYKCRSESLYYIHAVCRTRHWSFMAARQLSDRIQFNIAVDAKAMKGGKWGYWTAERCNGLLLCTSEPREPCESDEWKEEPLPIGTVDDEAAGIAVKQAQLEGSSNLDTLKESVQGAAETVASALVNLTKSSTFTDVPTKDAPIMNPSFDNQSQVKPRISIPPYDDCLDQTIIFEAARVKHCCRIFGMGGKDEELEELDMEENIHITYLRKGVFFNRKKAKSGPDSHNGKHSGRQPTHGPNDGSNNGSTENQAHGGNSSLGGGKKSEGATDSYECYQDHTNDVGDLVLDYLLTTRRVFHAIVHTPEVSAIQQRAFYDGYEGKIGLWLIRHCPRVWVEKDGYRFVSFHPSTFTGRSSEELPRDDEYHEEDEFCTWGEEDDEEDEEVYYGRHQNSNLNKDGVISTSTSGSSWLSGALENNENTSFSSLEDFIRMTIHKDEDEGEGVVL
ncbi:hypothetical protein M422DRAFT_775104 [Sphaerobolus stellatus SS14]|nr:hypothetical protein M422DRAFT_775104 [Sphaerobolus stellatus SS14]